MYINKHYHDFTIISQWTGIHGNLLIITECRTYNVTIFGIVPDIQENYPNLKRMWLETGIETFGREYTICHRPKVM